MCMKANNVLHIVIGGANCVKSNSRDLSEMKRQVLACALISLEGCDQTDSSFYFFVAVLCLVQRGEIY